MSTSLYLAIVLTICMGCGGGIKVISGEKLQITSAPSGAEIEVFELKRLEGSAWDQTSLPPSAYQGKTPMDISLNLLEATNRGVSFYLIQYKKNGYLPDIKIVKLSSRYKVDQPKAKAQNYLMPLMAIAPITIIPVGLAIGNKYYTAISMSIESIHAEMEPVNSATHNASPEIISCIENYLGIAAPRIEYQEKPLFVKIGNLSKNS